MEPSAAAATATTKDMPRGNRILVAVLADAILAGRSADAEAIVKRITRALGARRNWVSEVAGRYAAAFAGKTRPRRREVVAFLESDADVRRRNTQPKSAAAASSTQVKRLIAEPQRMQPVEAARAWPVPAIESTGALADWLGLDPGELEWFADLAGLCHHREPLASPLQHYFYRVIEKRTGGGGGVRMVEAPKPRLKMLQHRILHGLLAAIPAHEAAHGFRRGRSIQTFAAPHVGSAAVLRLDLEHFFPSIRAERVQALLRTAGYPERVADLIGGICTNATPRAAWSVERRRLPSSLWPRRVDQERLVAAIHLHANRHLPQGAPSSPALANLCAYRMDCRLAGLAAAWPGGGGGGGPVTYTRYADDLAFSGDGREFARAAGRLAAHVTAIAAEEGFAVNHRKTRLMRRGTRQHLAGLVTNEKLNVPRDDYDRLKATLHNCARHGPAGQNLDGHPAFREQLEGRVGFVESVNAARGARLRAIFDRISWQPE